MEWLQFKLPFSPAVTYTLAYGFASVIGLVMGSFYTALASRVLYYYYDPRHEDRPHPPHRLREMLTRRSFCMQCATPVAAQDLVPLLSYLSLSGRARCCRTPIGTWTLAGEALPGLLLPLMLFAGFSWPAAFLTILLCGQLYISIATDHKYQELGDLNTALVFLFGAAAAFAANNWNLSGLLPHLYTAGVVLGIFLLLYILGGIFKRDGLRQMGSGDVPLATALGFFVGFPWALILFNLASAGSIIHAAVIKRDLKAGIPFGVYLAGATMLTIALRCVWALWQNGLLVPGQ